MWKIFKYSFYDMIRNRWMFAYTTFFLLLTFALLILSNDLGKVIISLNNVILALTPLVGLLFGTMYYYNAREFIELLLAQPLSRRSILVGLYLGLATSLSISLAVGVLIPMILYGVLSSIHLVTMLILIAMSIVLSVVFSLLAFLIALKNENRIKGFGLAIFSWLFFAVVYDGIFLLLLLIFREYPLEHLTLGLTVFNPVDLARILILLNLDVSAMMGYTGAVLQKFLGSHLGSFIIVITLALWIVLPFCWMVRIVDRKDF